MKTQRIVEILKSGVVDTDIVVKGTRMWRSSP